MTTTETMQKERPIIFNAQSIPGILDGTKTQTRRVIKPQPTARLTHSSGAYWRNTHAMPGKRFLCPFGVPGDLLWVKEAWSTIRVYPLRTSFEILLEPPEKVIYKAGRLVFASEDAPPDGDFDKWPKTMSNVFDQLANGDRWKSPIYMPKKHTRIWLEVTDVRVERVWDISEADAIAEGCEAQGGRSSGPMDPAEYDGHDARYEFAAF